MSRSSSSSLGMMFVIHLLFFAPVACRAPALIESVAPAADGSEQPTQVRGASPLNGGEDAADAVQAPPAFDQSSTASGEAVPPLWGASSPAMPVMDSEPGEFEVSFHHLVVDGECVGEGDRDATGITLTIRGTITHNLPDRVNSATLRGVVFAEFGDEAKVLRSSSGMGFVEDVSSNDSWEQGVAREFEVVTRPIDPVYCLYTAERAAAALHLSVRTPLGMERSVTVAVATMPWQPSVGFSVDQTALALSDFVLVSPFARANVSAGSFVDVLYARRGRALFRNATGMIGWAEVDEINAGGPLLEVPYELRAAASFTEIGVELSAISMNSVDAVPGGMGTLSAIATYTNPSTSRRRSPFETIRVVQSNGDILRPRVTCDVPDLCEQNLEPGNSASAQLVFELTEDQRPVAIGVAGGAGQSLLQ